MNYFAMLALSDVKDINYDDDSALIQVIFFIASTLPECNYLAEEPREQSSHAEPSSPAQLVQSLENTLCIFF